MLPIKRVLLVAVLALWAANVLAAESGSAAMESSWLQLVKGYRGDSMGVQLMDIEKSEVDAGHKITLAIPKQKMGHPDQIEEVVVVGRAPEKAESTPLLNVSYEWVKDYDNDNHGLIITLGDGDFLPIRLYMNSVPGFTN